MSAVRIEMLKYETREFGQHLYVISKISYKLSTTQIEMC